MLAGGGGQLQLVQLQLVQQGPVGVAAVQLGVGVAGAELQLGVGVAATQPPLRLAPAPPTGGGAGHCAGRGESGAGGGVALETGRGSPTLLRESVIIRAANDPPVITITDEKDPAR